MSFTDEMNPVIEEDLAKDKNIMAKRKNVCIYN